MKRLNYAWTILDDLINNHGKGETITDEFMESLVSARGFLEDELMDRGEM